MIRHFILPAIVVVILGFAKGLIPASIVLICFLISIGLNRLGNSSSLGDRASREIVLKKGGNAQTTMYFLTCGSVLVMIATAIFLFVRYDWIVAGGFAIMVLLFFASAGGAVYEEQQQKDSTDGLVKQIAQRINFPIIIKYHPWYLPCIASIIDRSDLYKSDPKSADKILVEQMDTIGDEMGGYLVDKLLEMPDSDQKLRKLLNSMNGLTGGSFMKAVRENFSINDLGQFLTQKFSALHKRWTGISLTEELVGVKLDEDWR